MITMEELNPNDYHLDDEQAKNIVILLERINIIRAKYGKPMTVTSGVRSYDDQIRIYKAKGITDIHKIPMGSQHLHGAAVDIADFDGSLKKWVKNNVALLEELGLWCEDFAYTKNWIHFQISPPKSNSRFFKP